MTLGEKLRKLCDERRWRQADLVRAIVGDMHKSTMSNWWHDKNPPDLESALKIARALGVPLDYLADEEMDVPPVTLSEDERAILTIVRDLGLDRGEATRRLMTVVAHGRSAPSPDPDALPVKGEREERPPPPKSKSRRPGAAG